MRALFLLIIGLLWCNQAVNAQPGNLNLSQTKHYILSVQPTKPFYGSADELRNGTTEGLYEVTYSNGIGENQKIQIGASPDNQDLVYANIYNCFNLLINEYNPVPVTDNHGGYVSDARDKNRAYYPTTSAFASYIYWMGELSEIYNGYHEFYFEDRTRLSYNDSLCARRYVVRNDSLLCLGKYGKLRLKEKYNDNEERRKSNFYDFNDRLVSECIPDKEKETYFYWREHDPQKWLITYYVYDEYNDLRYVLTPEYRHSGDLNLHAYQYKYDGFHRCVEKKMPGCAPIKFIYDCSGRLVFTQDGNQRDHSPEEWTFYLYDPVGRRAVEGSCQNVDRELAAEEKASCTFALTGDVDNCGYTTHLTLDSAKVNKVSYYDNYQFLSLPAFAGKDFYSEATVSAQGLQTGLVNRIMGESTLLTEANYYDIKGRVVQNVKDNHLGGYDSATTSYTFTGKPETVYYVHVKGMGDTPVTENYSYEYDSQDRELSVSYQLNGQPSIVLESKNYDDLGRLKDRILGEMPSHKSTYSYNFIDRIEGIDGDLFSEHLNYKIRTDSYRYSSGNIYGMEWKVGNETNARQYIFDYDHNYQLISARYSEKNPQETNYDRFSGSYDYDRNGNITALKCYGKLGESGYGLVNNLTLAYQGNQLVSVEDSVTNVTGSKSTRFVDGVHEDCEYLYDANGNLIRDLNKNVCDIQYNALNLPVGLRFQNGDSINNRYDAEGNKLSVTRHTADSTVTTDYCDQVIYENGKLSRILTHTGYVTFVNSSPTFHYYLQDHQGNNRVVMNEHGNIEEVNHYYPFGGLFGEGTGNVSQPYKYNGKELDTANGLNWYDYGARMYDPALGRWNARDPMAEKYYPMSPYAYCNNNPILLIDPNGMWPTWRGIKKGLSNALDTSLSFVNGAVSAVADNMFLGSTSLRENGIYSSASAYNAGQDVGDVLSIIAGGAETIRGAGEVTAGVLGTPETAGASLSVSAKGALDVTHGSLMATSGAVKLFSKKGRVSEKGSNGYSKTSGRNEPHSNWKAREAAKKKMEAAQEKLKTMEKDKNSTKNERRIVEKEIKSWKKKMDNPGETHHRNK